MHAGCQPDGTYLAWHDMQAGIDRLPNLRVLLMSNNKIKDWSEVERLSGNAKLEELLLMGNPLVPATGTSEYRIEAKPTLALFARFCTSAPITLLHFSNAQYLTLYN